MHLAPGHYRPVDAQISAWPPGWFQLGDFVTDYLYQLSPEETVRTTKVFRKIPSELLGTSVHQITPSTFKLFN